MLHQGSEHFYCLTNIVFFTTLIYDLIIDPATSQQQEPDNDARNAQKGETVSLHHTSHSWNFKKEATKNFCVDACLF